MHHPPEPHPQSEPATPQPGTLRRRCRHIFAAGRQCGSPCLRAEQFCYYHHTTRRPVSDPRARASRTGVLDLPAPECRDSIRAALAQVMYAIAHDTIDPRRAGLLLYNLQISLCALPKEPPMPKPQAQSSARPKPQTKGQRTRQLHRELLAEQHRFEAEQAAERSGTPLQSLDSQTWVSTSPQPHPESPAVTAIQAARDPNYNPVNHIPAAPLIEDTVLDEHHGLIAPETFLEPEEEEEDEEDEDGSSPRMSLARQLYEEVLRYEARLKAKEEGYEQARADLLRNGKLRPPTQPENQPKPGIDIDAAAGNPSAEAASLSHVPRDSATSVCHSRRESASLVCHSRRESAFVLAVAFICHSRRESAFVLAPKTCIPTTGTLPRNIIPTLRACVEERVPPPRSPSRSRNFNPINRNSRNPKLSVKPLIYFEATAGGTPIRPDKLDRSHVAFPPGRLALHEQYPRDHRIPGRRQEALAAPA